MELLDVLDKIVRGRSAAQAAFTIAPDHVLDAQEEGEEIFLKPQASYFEIRLKQMHLRDQRDYQQPRGRGGLKPNSLQQRYEVQLNLPEDQLDQVTRETKFWVKEGRLFYGKWEDTVRPYHDADFLLYQVQPLSERSDYTSFDFHRVYWQEVLKAIWDGNEQGAWQKLRLMAGNLALCPDIVRPQRNLLLGMYRKQFDEELAIHADMFSGMKGVPTRDAEGFREQVEERGQALTEGAMVKAIRAESSPEALRQLQEKSPEATLSVLGL